MKTLVRKEALSQMKKLDSKIASNKIIEAILKSKILDNYSKIGIYYPINNEINIFDLINHYKDKTFYLPITRKEIYFCKYTSLDDLQIGKFNVMEPKEVITNRDEIECFLIPCVGITKHNQRLGYGKGYYDRYLSGYKGLKIGVCYKELQNLELDYDNYDIILDVIYSG